MIEVFPINALSDNYIWCLVNRANQRCVIVDPGETAPVFEALSAHQLQLSAILITHHHWDHTNGIKELIAKFDVPVYGPALEPVPGMTHPLNDGDLLTLDDCALSLQIMHVPGHTRGHIAYYNDQLLFCGDTLFTAGCGKIFEGTVPQMYHSLSAMAALSESTLVYCGHEYTAANLKFAQHVEPDNKDIQDRIEQASNLRAKNLPTVPAPLSLEKLTNPFLRCSQPSVIKAAQQYANQRLPTPIDVLRVIREWKNNF